MNARSFIPFLVLTLSVAASHSLAAEDDIGRFEGRIIRKIRIIRRNVFEDQAAKSSVFIYRWADALHVTTKESVIRRELLFSVGEPLDPEKILESQRNLRLTDLVGDAEVRAIPVGADSVDVELTTRDLWTTGLSLTFETGGGNYKVGLLYTEKNFLGSGQRIEALAQAGADENGFSLLYFDRRLFGTRVSTTLGYSDFTYERQYLLQIQKPRYALSVHSRFNAGYGHDEGTTRLFDNGAEYYRYLFDKDEVHSNVSYSFGERSSIDVVAAYDYTRSDYRRDPARPPLSGVIPPDETLAYPSLGIGAAHARYGVERYLDKAGTPEDLTYGPALRIMAGKSLRVLGADYQAWINTMSMRLLVKPLDRLVIGVIDVVSWQEREGLAQRIHHDSDGYVYIKTAAAQVLAFHLKTDFAWREIPSYQLLLGGDTGLRGYHYFRLSGDRLALGNIEYRFFTPLEIFSVKVGGAAFFDCGNVWREGEKIDLGTLKSDVGVGLRFGLLKSSTSRVVSIDLARALTESGYFLAIRGSLVFDLSGFQY
jgi:hypothetical protein